VRGEGFPKGYEYRWADGFIIKTPIRCTPSEYTTFVLEWVEEQLDNKSLFPEGSGGGGFDDGGRGAGGLYDSMGGGGSYGSRKSTSQNNFSSFESPGRSISGSSGIFRPQMMKILTRLFRVYAIVYHSHTHTLEAMNATQHLNTCFKHFSFFCFEFDFVNEAEFGALRGPVSKMKVSRAFLFFAAPF
jgi:MOB kinase activator 1